MKNRIRVKVGKLEYGEPGENVDLLIEGIEFEVELEADSKEWRLTMKHVDRIRKKLPEA